MAITSADLSSIQDSGDVYITNNTTGKVRLFIPYANTATYTLKGDKASSLAKGKNVVDFQQPSTLDIEYGVDLINLDIMSFISGSEVGEATKQFIKREVFDITSTNKDSVTITGTPAGDKIQAFTILKDYGGTHIKEISNTSASGKTVAFSSALTEGDRVAIYYYEEELCHSITIKGTPDESPNYKIDAIVAMKSSADTGEKRYLNLVIPKATVTQDITLSFDAKKPNNFSIKLSASENSKGELIDMREVPKA